MREKKDEEIFLFLVRLEESILLVDAPVSLNTYFHSTKIGTRTQ